MNLSQIPNINSNSCRTFPVEKENDFQGSMIFRPPGLTFSAAFIFQGEAFSTFLVQKNHTGTRSRKPFPKVKHLPQFQCKSTIQAQEVAYHFPHKRAKAETHFLEEYSLPRQTTELTTIENKNLHFPFSTENEITVENRNARESVSNKHEKKKKLAFFQPEEDGKNRHFG